MRITLKNQIKIYLMLIILQFSLPFGVKNEKVSPFFFPINASPSGEMCEIFLSCIFASSEPTIFLFYLPWRLEARELHDIRHFQRYLRATAHIQDFPQFLFCEWFLKNLARLEARQIFLWLDILFHQSFLI